MCNNQCIYTIGTLVFAWAIVLTITALLVNDKDVYMASVVLWALFAMILVGHQVVECRRQRQDDSLRELQEVTIEN